MTLTAVFVLALVSFILAILGALGRPLEWVVLILLSLALMLLSFPVPIR